MNKVEQCIAITNFPEHSMVDDNQIIGYIEDLQEQLNRDYFPIWHIKSKIYFVPNNEINQIPNVHWRLTIHGSSGSQGQEEGVHNYDESTGRALSYVYAIDASNHNIELSIVISHELLEMLTNPRKECITVDNKQIMKEICDPLGNSSYIINNTKVSNFVTPAWFKINNQSQYDYLNLNSQSLECLEGGTIINCTSNEFTRM